MVPVDVTDFTEPFREEILLDEAKEDKIYDKKNSTINKSLPYIGITMKTSFQIPQIYRY